MGFLFGRAPRSVLQKLLNLSLVLLFLPSCASHEPPPKSQHLEPISVAPDFAAKDELGKTRTLSEFRGRAVVLYFYPKDGTPGCTREACAFRDEWQQLKASGAQVLGVSIDSVESHAAFKKEHRLPFPLLSDPDGRVLQQYGVPRSPKGYASRTTFIIDAQGVIRRIFPEVDPAVHVKDVLATLRQLAGQGLDRAPNLENPPNTLTACEKAPAEPVSSKQSGAKTFSYTIEPARPETVKAPTAEETTKLEAHYQYWNQLREKGVAQFIGRSDEGPYYGIVIFYAADRAAAQTILDADPAVKSGTFKGRLQEFRQLFPVQPKNQ
jgi:thioredoxin-dependent peroxiredoxin